MLNLPSRVERNIKTRSENASGGCFFNKIIKRLNFFTLLAQVEIWQDIRNMAPYISTYTLSLQEEWNLCYHWLLIFLGSLMQWTIHFIWRPQIEWRPKLTLNCHCKWILLNGYRIPSHNSHHSPPFHQKRNHYVCFSICSFTYCGRNVLNVFV